MALTDPKLKSAQEAAQKAGLPPEQQQAMVQADRDIFGFVISADEIMVLILVVVVGFLAFHAWKAQRTRPNFNLIDLILDDDGRISPERTIVMVAFSLHSWTMLKWIITGAVSTADFATYGTIWVAPLIVAIIKSRKNGAAPVPVLVQKGEI